MKFTRGQFLPGGGVRKYPNMITTWVDGSQVYGSDPLTNCILRSFSQGKLKTSANNLLPLEDGLFRAGDIRSGENFILTSYHTLFLREHNRLCDRILS